MIDLTSIANEVLDFFSNVSDIYLYGSRARGDYNKTSDIDLAIIFNKKRVSNYFTRMKGKDFFTRNISVIGLSERRFNTIKKAAKKKRRYGFRQKQDVINQIKKIGKKLYEVKKNE